MAADAKRQESKSDPRRHTPEFLLAFAIGTLVGIGLALTWVPKRRRRGRLPVGIGESYRRLRRASLAALDDIRQAGREAAGEFRDELGASLEAAREEFADMAREQLGQVRRTVRREHKKLRH